jgi:hypothetical protein
MNYIRKETLLCQSHLQMSCNGIGCLEQLLLTFSLSQGNNNAPVLPRETLHQTQPKFIHCQTLSIVQLVWDLTSWSSTMKIKMQACQRKLKQSQVTGLILTHTHTNTYTQAAGPSEPPQILGS